MTSPAETLSTRLEALRSQLLANIPAMADSETVLQTLNLPQSMLVYVNWAARFIKPRRRSVSFAPAFWKSESAMERGGDVLALEAAVRAGSDLTPYLSGRVFRDGYRSLADDRNGKRLKWADKDFALNAYGIHHLHFLPLNGRARGIEPGKHGHLLYAEFTRYHATFLMVGDHKSFDDGTLHDAVVEARAASGTWELSGIRPPRDPEDHREQFRLARRGQSTVGFKDGRAFVGASISTAGTSPFHSAHAARILRTLSAIDPKLDDEAYWQGLFQDAGRPPPVSADFSWHSEYTELSVMEHNSKTKFILVNGLN